MIVKKLAYEFYTMTAQEVADKLRQNPKWPYDRRVERVLSIQEAVHRLESAPLRILVANGFVGVVESGGQLYPIQIPDVVLGHNSQSAIDKARLQAEARAVLADHKREKGRKIDT